MIRFTESNKWSDPWFRALPPECKLAFLYIIDNCDNAGFWEVDLGMMAFQTGIEERALQGALKGLQRGIVGASGWVWVRNYLRHQKNENINPSNPAHKQIIALLKSQLTRFPSILEHLEQRGMEGALKGLQSPIGTGTGTGSSLGKEGAGENPIPDLCTLEQAKSAAPMCGMTDDEAEVWWHSRRANGWLKGTGGNGHAVKIGSFQSDMKGSVGWVRKQIAENGVNGQKPKWKPNL